MLLLHAIFVRALAPGLQIANLIAALVALAGGLAFRWLQRATAVIAVVFGVALFVFVYMFGIAAPLSFLVLMGQVAWVSWAALASVVVLGTFLSLRVRASLRDEWSKPLGETPGIHIATSEWILRQEVGRRESPVLNMFAILLGLALIPTLALTRGSPQYLAVAMLVGPICVALMLTDTVARWMGFYIAVRRWEAQHGIRLRFPRVPARSSPRRKRSPRAKRGR
jgi:hypothetical protein